HHEQYGTTKSLNGITYLVKSEDNDKFVKFIQHEPAYVFHHIFTTVFNQETALDMQVILHVYDEILVAVKDTESIGKICEMKINAFQMVAGQSALKIETAPVRGGHSE